MWLIRRKTHNPGVGEAERAVAKSQKALDETKARTPEISSLMDAMKRIREHNHLQELVRSAIEGKT